MLYLKNLVFISILLLFIIACNNNPPETKNTNLILPTGSTPGTLQILTRVCCFSDVDSFEKKLHVALDVADEREKNAVNEIMNYAGLPANFLIFRGNIDNAMALTVEEKRLIIYNKNLLKTIDRMSDSYWSSIFILAHEIGHHLAFNLTDTLNALQAEFDADKFATNIMYKMGADSNQVLLAVNSRFISNEQDTKTHPAKGKRLQAIRNEWLQASGLESQSAIPPEPADQHENEFHYGKLALWDTPNSTYHILDTINNEIIISRSENVEAVILKNYASRKNDLTFQDYGGQQFDLLLQIRNTDPSTNQIGLTKNQRIKVSVFFLEEAVGGGRPEYILNHLCAGRIIRCALYGYDDLLGDPELRLVDVSGLR